MLAPVFHECTSYCLRLGIGGYHHTENIPLGKLYYNNIHYNYVR